ncbi:GINS DNA replication complex subunit Sld5 [Aspergillus bombycis]|uniref:DNA replication complex GINS protein SLD5 n=1 Tax=Aspergillus bombycis TaxID=109264 RepID=A0A1F8AFE7_9EURO|nr:GINS DNA replication complex subunit Sld5 [Aspergillus bombycis]OGM50483.1 GINS DNA replication complex subunit Sld5 [Aspergillus bombycis]
MDIDDILASVDRNDVSTPESTQLDHQLLTRFWVAERGVSELLPWPEALMNRMMERVRKQIETIEDLASSSSDPTITTTTTTNNNNSNSNNPTLNLKLSILQTDLSRTQYLLRSILRQRLSKLTKHSMHYLLRISSASSQQQQQTPADSQTNDQQPEDSIPDLTAVHDPSPLSTQELDFLRAHQTLLAGHFGASFLSSFPAQLRRLDDNAGGVSMVQGPDAREVVFVRCLVEKVGVVVPPGDGVEVETVGEEMRMGDVWVVRWEGVREAWERGEVEVL